MPDEPERPNWVARIATVIWQPSLVFMPFLIMGIVLWLCPSMEGASGYIVREEITFSNLGILGVLVCVYLHLCMDRPTVGSRDSSVDDHVPRRDRTANVLSRPIRTRFCRCGERVVGGIAGGVRH